MSQDKEMEKEIQAKGLIAPRVTLDQIEALMEKVEFKVHIVEGTTTTMAVAVLEGFTLAKEFTACVDPLNFNKELGEKYAILKSKAAAKDKLWELEGYRLKFS